jgi:hypothetical protein
MVYIAACRVVASIADRQRVCVVPNLLSQTCESLRRLQTWVLVSCTKWGRMHVSKILVAPLWAYDSRAF